MRLVPWLVVAFVAGACALPSSGEFARSSIVAPDGGGDGGATTLDAGNDGRSVTDAGADAPVGFCPRTAVYCNDFSSGVADLGGPTYISDAVASITVVDGALQAKIEALPQKGHYQAQATYALPNEAVKASIEVDLLVSTAPWDGGNMVVLGYYYDGKPNDHATELYIDGNQSSITTSENGQFFYDTATQDLPRGKWVHVKFDVDFTPHSGSFRVWYDGALAISHAGAIDFTPVSPASFIVMLGMIRNNAPTPALTTSYDNLVITLP